MAHRTQFNQLTVNDSAGRKDKWHRCQVRNLYENPYVYAFQTVLVLIVVCFFGAVAAVAAEPTPPDFREIEQAAAVYFASLPGYKPGDLISQKDVAAVLDAVADLGWEVPNGNKLVDRALADDSFLVRELSTKSGRKFMRQIATTPGGYERLDQLSKVSRGETTVRELIHAKGGYELIIYMATTPQGHNLGKMMADVPRGVDLNKPTNRIYTADELITALKQAYRQSSAS